MPSKKIAEIPEVDLAACRGRQQRLLAEMQQRDLQAAIMTRMESIQWLTGARVGPLFKPSLLLDANHGATLVLPSRKKDTPAAADHVLIYEEKWLSTMRDACDQAEASLAALCGATGKLPERVGCEFTAEASPRGRDDASEWIDLDAVMFRLRRRKDADELAMMQRANEANRVMYELAAEIIEPGLNELDLFNQLQAAAICELGEPLTYIGQDFRANARGGAPRNRCAEAGELWILDLGVGLRGYYTDNARTFAVGGEPSADQQEAHRRLLEVFPMIEQTVKPGVACVEVFEKAKSMLSDCDPWQFNHHLGHGVGLAPHEWPHLNPNWDDTFEVGDFFTVEPGLYHDELKHGLRLEQNYVVTDSGVELQTDWPWRM